MGNRKSAIVPQCSATARLLVSNTPAQLTCTGYLAIVTNSCANSEGHVLVSKELNTVYHK